MAAPIHHPTWQPPIVLSAPVSAVHSLKFKHLTFCSLRCFSTVKSVPDKPIFASPTTPPMRAKQPSPPKRMSGDFSTVSFFSDGSGDGNNPRDINALNMFGARPGSLPRKRILRKKVEFVTHGDLLWNLRCVLCHLWFVWLCDHCMKKSKMPNSTLATQNTVLHQQGPAIHSDSAAVTHMARRTTRMPFRCLALEMRPSQTATPFLCLAKVKTATRPEDLVLALAALKTTSRVRVVFSTYSRLTPNCFICSVSFSMNFSSGRALAAISREFERFLRLTRTLWLVQVLLFWMFQLFGYLSFSLRMISRRFNFLNAFAREVCDCGPIFTLNFITKIITIWNRKHCCLVIFRHWCWTKMLCSGLYPSVPAEHLAIVQTASIIFCWIFAFYVWTTRSQFCGKIHITTQTVSHHNHLSDKSQFARKMLPAKENFAHITPENWSKRSRKEI